MRCRDSSGEFTGIGFAGLASSSALARSMSPTHLRKSNGGGASLMAALVIVSTFGAVNGIILVGPRVYYQMARDGTIFQWMGAVHPRFGTPHRALAIQAVWASVLAASNTYGALFSRVIYTEWIFFAAMAAGLMLLRRRASYRPAYRIPAYPLVPILFISASLVIVAMKIAEAPVDSAVGLGLVLVGWPIYLIWARYRSSAS